MSDGRTANASRRGTIIAQAEAAATDRLCASVDVALSRLWNRYSTAELHELTQSLTSKRPAPVVRRLDEDLARLARAFDGG